MLKFVPAVLIVALATVAPAPPTLAALAAPSPSPASHAGTPPPQIYHIITRPLCSELHQHIAPAVGMMLQNDAQIKKSPDLMDRYNRAALEGTNSSGPTRNGINSFSPDDNTSTPGQQMALLGMENLVSPIANNIIAIKKLLDSPALTTGTGNPEDDQRLAEIRAKLINAVKMQEGSLDIINGFVQTQQMGDLQHAGQGYISSISQSDVTNGKGLFTPTPNPLTYDPNQAGIAPDPYTINPATIPGLTLGYNPVTRLLEGLHWTIAQTQSNENVAASAILESKSLCDNGGPAAPNTPHP